MESKKALPPYAVIVSCNNLEDLCRIEKDFVEQTRSHQVIRGRQAERISQSESLLIPGDPGDDNIKSRLTHVVNSDERSFSLVTPHTYTLYLRPEEAEEIKLDLLVFH